MKVFPNRRDFLKAAAAASAMYSSTSARLLAQASAPGLRFGRDKPGVTVPANFVGLSYESMQLEDSTFFSPANTSLIQQVKAIAPQGVLRLGGNTSEFGWWKTSAAAKPPKRSESPWKATGEPTAATLFAITPEAIDNLDGFLRATGWSCIYGLNLGYGTPELDLPEAVYVFEKLGPRLEYFQVGNEVDLFKNHLRDPATWNVDRYLDEWLVIAHAVQARLPGARFGMPDVASDVSWLQSVAQRWPGLATPPHLVCMSHHYYWSGPPSNPNATVENLLKPDPRVVDQGKIAAASAHGIGPKVQWRMTEGNTVYRGGKDGLSDVFASALWSADYLLELMSMGYAGVNLHGGSGHAQAVSVGGSFVGEALMADPTAPHPKPFYTPIANVGTLAGAGVNGRLSSAYVLEPVGVGMAFAAQFCGCRLLPVELSAGSVNATAYAARTGKGEFLVAIVNKDAERSLALNLPPIRQVTLLSAHSLTSRSANLITREATPDEKQGKLQVPAATAMLLHLGR